MPSAQQCKADTLRFLDRDLRTHSPYAQSYRMMHEVEADCIRQAAAANTQPPEIRMVFDQQSTLDRRRYTFFHIFFVTMHCFLTALAGMFLHRTRLRL